MKPPRKSENELILGLVSISDRASTGVYDDRGIPELEAWCRKSITNPLTVHKRLIADERFDIEKTLRELVDIIGCDLILTNRHPCTAHTGFKYTVCHEQEQNQ